MIQFVSDAMNLESDESGDRFCVDDVGDGLAIEKGLHFIADAFYPSLIPLFVFEERSGGSL